MSFPHPIRAVVFDMDGLLVDTEVLIRDLMIKASLARGAHLPFEVFQQMVGLPDQASNAVARAHFGDDFPLEELLAEVSAGARAACEVGVALKAGVVDLLDYLDTAQIPRAICTSSSHGAVQRTLGPSGILPRFDAIVAAGDYPRGKPNPEPFLAAATRLNVAPQACLALEDSHNGVRAAHAAGMMTVMVPDLLEPTDEMREKCHAIAESLHHVRAMIEQGATAGL
ncbi:MAG TPA: HAD family phosphatase [Caulobacteraceae bacterium]|jgi:beta-phosphoglucomutase-like phosphatase (HAD superfamily)|nr:HAD family phosphatase [Caulobacteraceae bacterium]